MQVYCLIKDTKDHSVSSNAVTLTIAEHGGPIITQQPESQTIKLGDELTVSVAAEGENLTYQWYYMKKGATAWTKWNNRTNAIEKVTPNATWDGMKLYCVVSDSHGKSLDSEVATITFGEPEPAIKITSQPQNVNVPLGSEVKPSVVAEGDGLTYQWYFMKKGATTWTKWNGRTHATEKVTPNESWDGIKLYCVVKDGSGNTLDSNVATITFVQQSSQLKITQHPSNVTAAAGENVSFVVKATGEGELTYQWYIKKVNGDWKAWTGHTTPTTSATTNSTWNGMQIYCTVTDDNGNSVTSNAATITIY